MYFLSALHTDFCVERVCYGISFSCSFPLRIDTDAVIDFVNNVFLSTVGHLSWRDVAADIDCGRRRKAFHC